MFTFLKNRLLFARYIVIVFINYVYKKIIIIILRKSI